MFQIGGKKFKNLDKQQIVSLLKISIFKLELLSEQDSSYVKLISADLKDASEILESIRIERRDSELVATMINEIANNLQTIWQGLLNKNYDRYSRLEGEWKNCSVDAASVIKNISRKWKELK